MPYVGLQAFMAFTAGAVAGVALLIFLPAFLARLERRRKG